MRIIGGEWRSRRLLQPQTAATRPVPDRVRQAVFELLGSRYDTPGSLPPLAVGDVFAGSGSMGLEALSRGAAQCWFFERDREALRVLQANIDALAAGDRARTLTGNAWLLAARAVDRPPFDLVFLDPPYADSDDTGAGGHVRRFLQAQPRDEAGFGPRPLLVLHHYHKVRYELAADEPWATVDERTIGSNRITLFQPRPLSLLQPQDA